MNKFAVYFSISPYAIQIFYIQNENPHPIYKFNNNCYILTVLVVKPNDTMARMTQMRNAPNILIEIFENK
jgi:hypothetical protein